MLKFEVENHQSTNKGGHLGQANQMTLKIKTRRTIKKDIEPREVLGNLIGLERSTKK